MILIYIDILEIYWITLVFIAQLLEPSKSANREQSDGRLGFHSYLDPEDHTVWAQEKGRHPATLASTKEITKDDLHSKPEDLPPQFDTDVDGVP